MNIQMLRSCIGYVGQEPVLFSGTIQDNIELGKLEYCDALPNSHIMSPKEEDSQLQIEMHNMDDESTYDLENQCTEVDLNCGVNRDILHACDRSQAHQFISTLPLGYKTELGVGAFSSISGGQKQRIAIARALMKRPAILLLDEATSALDVVSERLVQQSLDELQKSKSQTTLIIAHRLSTIRNADRIIVMDGGTIVEVGNHDVLMANGGVYSNMYLTSENL
jgi:ABC-type multidrug transport system fused ATPase/permease subunit